MEFGDTRWLPFIVNCRNYILATILGLLLFKLVLKRPWCKDQRPSLKESRQESLGSEVVEDTHIVGHLSLDLEHVAFDYKRPTMEELEQRSLEFYRLANGRRTLRFFSSDPVPREVIRNLIRAAGTSPSGAHTEPWTFVVVSSGLVKHQVRNIVEREEELNYLKRMGTRWTSDLLPLRTSWCKQYLTDAPYLIFIFRQEYSVLSNGQRKVHYYKELSAAIACGILITGIQYSGLVTLTSTPLNCGPALRQLLKRPLSEKLVLLLPVGYPSENATVPALKRKDLREILIEVE